MDDREEQETAVDGPVLAWVRRAVNCWAGEEERVKEDEEKTDHRRPFE